MSDDLRAQYPAIFDAVRSSTVPVERDLVRLIVWWLGDYARVKQLPGQPGVPQGVLAAQAALSEAYAVSDSSRQRQSEALMADEILGWSEVGTEEASAELGISTGGVRWLCRNGSLESRKVGRQVLISKASVEDYKRRKAERSA